MSFKLYRGKQIIFPDEKIPIPSYSTTYDLLHIYCDTTDWSYILLDVPNWPSSTLMLPLADTTDVMWEEEST
jgi:hypothetical protein